MCRNIRPLFNFDPPTTDDEVRATAMQFVRKLSGFSKPSHVNEAAFDRAVDDITHAARHRMASLVTSADPRQREAGTSSIPENRRRTLTSSRLTAELRSPAF